MSPERREIVERVAARLKAIHKDWHWVGERLNESAQTLNNWRHERGIPTAKYAAVAKLLGWSVEELLGHERNTPGDPWPFPHIPASRFADLTEGQLLQAEGVLLDKLNELERAPLSEKQQPAAMERAHSNARPPRNRKIAP